MSISSAKAIRDLSLLYKNEEKLITSAAQFNNAFSMISWDALDEHMFDEATTNLEDVIWAHEEIRRGNNLLYSPDASVVHYHGPNHDDSIERLDSTTKTIKLYEKVFHTKLVKPKVDPGQVTYVCFGSQNIALMNAMQQHEFSTSTLVAVNFENTDTLSLSFDKIIKINIETDFLKPIYSLLPKLVSGLIDEGCYSPYFVVLDNSFDENYPLVTPSMAADAIRCKFANAIWPVAATKNLHFDIGGNLLGMEDMSTFISEKVRRYEAKRGNGLIVTQKAMRNPQVLIKNYKTMELTREN